MRQTKIAFSRNSFDEIKCEYYMLGTLIKPPNKNKETEKNKISIKYEIISSHFREYPSQVIRWKNNHNNSTRFHLCLVTFSCETIIFMMISIIISICHSMFVLVFAYFLFASIRYVYSFQYLSQLSSNRRCYLWIIIYAIS